MTGVNFIKIIRHLVHQLDASRRISKLSSSMATKPISSLQLIIVVRNSLIKTSFIQLDEQIISI